MEEIEKVVDKVVEKKIAPIRKMLLEQKEDQQQASLERIIAGIGIIFGVAGIAVLLREKLRKKES